MRLQISQRHLIIRFTTNRTKKILPKTFQQFKSGGIYRFIQSTQIITMLSVIQILQLHKQLLMPKYCPLCKRIA